MVHLGKKKIKNIEKVEKPKTKYRVVIRGWKDGKETTCRSFMVYDNTNKTTIDSIKRKLESIFREE